MPLCHYACLLWQLPSEAVEFLWLCSEFCRTTTEQEPITLFSLRTTCWIQGKQAVTLLLPVFNTTFIPGIQTAQLAAALDSIYASVLSDRNLCSFLHLLWISHFSSQGKPFDLSLKVSLAIKVITGASKVNIYLGKFIFFILRPTYVCTHIQCACHTEIQVFAAFAF